MLKLLYSIRHKQILITFYQSKTNQSWRLDNIPRAQTSAAWVDIYFYDAADDSFFIIEVWFCSTYVQDCHDSGVQNAKKIFEQEWNSV